MSCKMFSSRFSRDIEQMTGEKVGLYWQVTWRFVAPLMMFVLFFASLVISLMDQPKYHAYKAATVSLFFGLFL